MGMNEEIPKSSRPVVRERLYRQPMQWIAPSEKSRLRPEKSSRLALMNLALHGVAADFGPEHADTFRHALRADFSRN